MLIFHSVTITVPEKFTQCTTRGSFVQHWQETLYNMFTFACLFLLPLIIMIVCYTRILVEISSRMTHGNSRSNYIMVVISRCSSIQLFIRGLLSALHIDDKGNINILTYGVEIRRKCFSLFQCLLRRYISDALTTTFQKHG